MNLLNFQTMFGGGLWIVPVALLTLIGLCAYKVRKARKSGWKQQSPHGKWIESDEPPAYGSIPAFIYGCLLTAALIAFLLIQYFEQ